MECGINQVMSRKLLFSFLLFALLVFLIIFVSSSQKEINQPQNLVQQKSTPTFPYFSKNSYLQALQKTNSDNKQNVVAGIVPHHFLAKDTISEFFQNINANDKKTVILIGPDHFNYLQVHNLKIASTKALPWKTPFGPLVLDQELIDSNNFPINDLVFMNEHSIYTLLPFVKKTLPQLSFVPLVLGNNKDYDYYYNLAKNLNNKDALLIISSDFSHYTTQEKAYLNDQRSIEVFKSKQMSEINDIECDCRPCIAFLFGYLADKTVTFELLENTDSYNISEEGPNNVTSYISAYYY